VVDQRFPSEWAEADAPPPPPAWFATAQASDEQRNVLFNPYPTYPVAMARSEPEAAAVSPEPAPVPEVKAPVPTVAVKAAAVKRPPARRAVEQRSNVLNDTQIASIRKRLNLTPDQERYWPAVEAALRELAYNKDVARKGGQGRNIAQVDVNSPSVDRLKSAVIPLALSFTDDQKQEARNLAHLIGLGNMASRF
jgi:hypothetical protein